MLLLGFFVLNTLRQTLPENSDLPWYLDLEHSVNVPNYLVFFATAISAYLLFRTLNRQTEANQIAAFENKYFKYIDYHRENVNQLKYRDPKSKEEKYWLGNQVFTVIYYEIKTLLGEYCNSDEFSNLDGSKKKEIINFIYHCVFYGAGSDGLDSIARRFPDNCTEEFTKIYFVNRAAAYHGSDLETSKGSPKYYSGHVRHLGQYYRNLYQAVKYVDKQAFLSESQKYEYVTMLRAQVSVHEQLVFFFNAISELGASWELEHYHKSMPSTKAGKKALYQKLLITKYDFVRNVLNKQGKILNRISISELFPLIVIEGNEECGVSGVLPFDKNTTHICRFCFNERYIGYKNEDSKAKISEYFTTENMADRNFR